MAPSATDAGADADAETAADAAAPALPDAATAAAVSEVEPAVISGVLAAGFLDLDRGGLILACFGLVVHGTISTTDTGDFSGAAGDAHALVGHALTHIIRHIRQRDALLLHGVALANRHSIVVNRVKVHGDAQRRTDFVFATVTATDSASLVIIDHPTILTQVSLEVVSDILQLRLLGQRQDSRLHRGETRIEAQHRALVDAALGIRRFVHVVSVNEECHERTGQACSRLNHIRRVALAGRLVEVAQVFAGVLGVCGKVVIRAVCDSFELTPVGTLETELVFDVDGALGIMRELGLSDARNGAGLPD